MHLDDIDYEEYLGKLGVLKHESMRPPRNGFIAEQVYAEFWKRWMAPRDEEFFEIPNYLLACEILRHMRGYVTQRHATVVASIVTWLGTNCGRGTIEQAKQFIHRYHMHGTQAYLCAWANDNQRLVFMNHGVRTLEHLLAPDDHFGRELFTGGIVLQKFPDLSAADYETAEQFWCWLADQQGQRFIEECEAEIKEREALEYRREHPLQGARGAVPTGDSHG